MNTIEMMRTDTDVLSIERFMALSEKEKRKIKSIKIIPPKLDDLHNDNFGTIFVTYKTPTYNLNF